MCRNFSFFNSCGCGCEHFNGRCNGFDGEFEPFGFNGRFNGCRRHCHHRCCRCFDGCF